MTKYITKRYRTERRVILKDGGQTIVEKTVKADSDEFPAKDDDLKTVNDVNQQNDYQ